MRAALTCLIAVLLAVPLFAQSTVDVDFRVWDLRGDTVRVPIGTIVQYRAVFTSAAPLTSQVPVELDIPGTITEVISPDVPCSVTHPMRCILGAAGSNTTMATVDILSRLDTPRTHTAVVRVQGREVARSVEVVDLPSLSIYAMTYNLPGDRVSPGGLLQYISGIKGTGAVPANVRVRYTLPNGGTFTAARPADPAVTCSVTPQEVVCTLPPPSGQETRIEVDALAPEQLEGGTVLLRAEVTHSEPDFDPSDNVAEETSRIIRGLAVRNTNDEGSGSLRQALLDAQALCANEPCAVVFRIPGTAPDGVFTIAPKSALPEVRGRVKIDGATQAGARIALSGRDAGLAHGLLLGEGCELQVLNLRISGFAWPGIEGRGSFRSFCNSQDQSFSGTLLIAGNEIANNHRGIVLVDTGRATIRDNVIQFNTRSGIFVDRAFFATITGNIVAGNGASGMFFNFRDRPTANGAHVHDNVIVGNREWGITRTSPGWVAIQRNTISGNVHPAIDLDLDFETPNRADDDLTSIPNKPVLFSAHYDPVQGKTFVTGRLETNNVAGGVELDFYVDNHPTRRHLAAWVGSWELLPGELNGDFTFAVPYDLRGLYLVATNTRSRYLFARPPDVGSDGHPTGLLTDTSEVSNAVPVQ